MPQIDQNHVKLCGGFVVWDGVNSPETVSVGKRAGKQKYTLKVVFPPQCPDIAVFDQLANQQLTASKWRGQLPPGGRMPIQAVQAGKYEGRFDGWSEISFKTTLKLPDVYDDADVNGPKSVDPMQLGSYIYTGQKVDVLAHCYDYDEAGNRGVAAGLDAVNCVTSAAAERLNIGGYDTSGAFGGSAQSAAAPPAAPAPGPVPTQQHNYLPPQGAAAPPPQEVKFRTPDGGTFTEQQLQASGWQPAQIQALPRA